jgi:hypothetical protein
MPNTSEHCFSKFCQSIPLPIGINSSQNSTVGRPVMERRSLSALRRAGSLVISKELAACSSVRYPICSATSMILPFRIAPMLWKAISLDSNNDTANIVGLPAITAMPTSVGFCSYVPGEICNRFWPLFPFRANAANLAQLLNAHGSQTSARPDLELTPTFVFPAACSI